MSTQDYLTYLLEAIALTFTAIALLDFLSGLLSLFNRKPRVTPNPVDIAPIFETAPNPEECAPLSHKSIAPIEDPWTQREDTLALPPAPVAATPDLSSMTRNAIAQIAKKHGIQHYRPNCNRRRTKAELLAELSKLQLV